MNTKVKKIYMCFYMTIFKLIFINEYYCHAGEIKRKVIRKRHFFIANTINI